MRPAGRPNKLALVSRALAGLVGFFLLILGVGFLTLPEVFAAGFFLEPARAVGINALRGDFGALFLGSSVFCFTGIFTRYRFFLIVPIVLLLLVLTGRIIGLIVDGPPYVVISSILVESVLASILIFTLAVHNKTERMLDQPFRFSEILNFRMLKAVAAVAAMVGLLFLSQEKIAMNIVKVFAGRFIRVDVIGDLPDGLHVGLNGTGAPLPDGKRAGPGVFIIAGKNLFIVDAGPGSVRKLELMKLPTDKVRAVFMTHYHSDHIGDLGELMLKRWAGGGNTTPLVIFGPRGVETVVKGFNLAYSLDSEYRVGHHGQEVTPRSGAGGAARPFTFPEGVHELKILEKDGLTVTAFPVDHRPVEPAVGYRFDYKGRSAVISGDTLPCDSLRRQAKGVDLLIHEALDAEMVQMLTALNQKAGRGGIADITEDILDYHTFPEEAARIAAETGVGRLVLYHFLPPLPAAVLEKPFLAKAKRYYDGPISIGEDGMLFSMPAQSDVIRAMWVLK